MPVDKPFVALGSRNLYQKNVSLIAGYLPWWIQRIVLEIPQKNPPKKSMHRDQQIKKQADKVDKAKDHWLMTFVIYILFMCIQWFVKGKMKIARSGIKSWLVAVLTMGQ